MDFLENFQVDEKCENEAFLHEKASKMPLSAINICRQRRQLAEFSDFGDRGKNRRKNTAVGSIIRMLADFQGNSMGSK